MNGWLVRIRLIFFLFILVQLRFHSRAPGTVSFMLALCVPDSSESAQRSLTCSGGMQKKWFWEKCEKYGNGGQWGLGRWVVGIGRQGLALGATLKRHTICGASRAVGGGREYVAIDWVVA